MLSQLMEKQPACLVELCWIRRMLQMFAKRRERKMGRDELRPASSLHLCEFCAGRMAAEFGHTVDEPVSLRSQLCLY